MTDEYTARRQAESEISKKVVFDFQYVISIKNGEMNINGKKSKPFEIPELISDLREVIKEIEYINLDYTIERQKP